MSILAYGALMIQSGVITSVLLKLHEMCLFRQARLFALQKVNTQLSNKTRLSRDLLYGRILAGILICYRKANFGGAYERD